MKNPRARSEWVPLLAGRVTAAGAPSRRGLAEWKERGATGVLTLQRSDEMRPNLPADCRDLDLAWQALPLSGRRLEDPQDQLSLAEIPVLLQAFGQTGAGLVVHCAAGMHRTGLVCFLLMRYAGLSLEDSVESVRKARPLTADELLRRPRNSRCLLDIAEELFAARAANLPD